MTGPLVGKRGEPLATRENWLPLTSWRTVVLRDPCPYCAVVPRADFGKHRMSVEHVRPQSLGGSNLWENIVGAHEGCNQQRSSRPLLRFLLFRQMTAGLPKKQRRRIRLAFFAGAPFHPSPVDAVDPVEGIVAG